MQQTGVYCRPKQQEITMTACIIAMSLTIAAVLVWIWDELRG